MNSKKRDFFMTILGLAVLAAFVVSIVQYGRDLKMAEKKVGSIAEIEVPSKLAATELGVYVKRKTGKNRYLCEFRNPGLFMGMLLASGERIRIVRPQWLKKRFAEACLALAEVNGAFSESD